MQVSIEKAELHWTTNSEANRLRHWIWKKPIVQHCNMVHDRMVMIWKVQWCSWINQNESFSIISKLQNEKRKESRLYYISKRYLTLDLLGSVFAFLTSRKPQCLGMHLWTVRRVRNAGGQYLAFEKLPKRSTLCFALLPQKLSNILEERWSFLILSEQSYSDLTAFPFKSFKSYFVEWRGE